MMKCEVCIYFKKFVKDFDKEYHGIGAGSCNNEHFVYGEEPIPKASLSYYDYEGYSAGFNVHKDFGCIHYEPKVNE